MEIYHLQNDKLLKDVLSVIISNGRNLPVVCYDEYSYMPNVTELDKHGAMFAYKRNDKK